MITNILTAEGVYVVRNAAELRTKHRSLLAALNAAGIAVVEHDDLDPYYVRVDYGRWLFDCVCGSGVAAKADWPEARCFGCGAVYYSVVFPIDAARIEELLLRRPMAGRFWYPNQTTDDLIAENLEHGVSGD